MNISIFYEKQNSYKTIKDLTYHIGNVGVELKESNQNREDIDIAAYTYNDAKYIRKEIQVNNEDIYFLYIYLNVYSDNLEDLEYYLNKLEGISQSNINSNIGFSFSCALRSFLRHDPDVIFIGEIRDSDTAELAIRAAMTGHTVFATLHANGTENTVARLVDLGIDKIMISEALTCIIHQQLVKQDKYQQTTNQNHASENLPGRIAKFDYLFVDDELRSKIKNSKF